MDPLGPLRTSDPDRQATELATQSPLSSQELHGVAAPSSFSQDQQQYNSAPSQLSLSGQQQPQQYTYAVPAQSPQAQSPQQLAFGPGPLGPGSTYDPQQAVVLNAIMLAVTGKVDTKDFRLLAERLTDLQQALRHSQEAARRAEDMARHAQESVRTAAEEIDTLRMELEALRSDISAVRREARSRPHPSHSLMSSGVVSLSSPSFPAQGGDGGQGQLLHDPPARGLPSALASTLTASPSDVYLGALPAGITFAGFAQSNTPSHSGNDSHFGTPLNTAVDTTSASPASAFVPHDLPSVGTLVHPTTEPVLQHHRQAHSIGNLQSAEPHTTLVRPSPLPPALVSSAPSALPSATSAALSGASRTIPVPYPGQSSTHPGFSRNAPDTGAVPRVLPSNGRYDNVPIIAPVGDTASASTLRNTFKFDATLDNTTDIGTSTRAFIMRVHSYASKHGGLPHNLVFYLSPQYLRVVNGEVSVIPPSADSIDVMNALWQIVHKLSEHISPEDALRFVAPYAPPPLHNVAAIQYAATVYKTAVADALIFSTDDEITVNNAALKKAIIARIPDRLRSRFLSEFEHERTFFPSDVLTAFTALTKDPPAGRMAVSFNSEQLRAALGPSTDQPAPQQRNNRDGGGGASRTSGGDVLTRTPPGTHSSSGTPPSHPRPAPSAETLILVKGPRATDGCNSRFHAGRDVNHTNQDCKVDPLNSRGSPAVGSGSPHPRGPPPSSGSGGPAGGGAGF